MLRLAFGVVLLHEDKRLWDVEVVSVFRLMLLAYASVRRWVYIADTDDRGRPTAG